MASERRRDEAAPHNTDLSQPPFPLPPGWVYHPRSPDASLETLRSLAGIFHHDGQVKIASIFDENEDRDDQTFWFDDAAEDPDAGS